MTVKEFVETNYGKDIKIGFCKGFVYCDTSTPEKTLLELKNMSQNYIHNCDRQIKELEDRIHEIEDDSWYNKLCESHTLKLVKLRSRLAKAILNKKEKNQTIFECKHDIEKAKEKHLLTVIKNMDAKLKKDCYRLYNCDLSDRNAVALDLLERFSSHEVKYSKDIQKYSKRLKKIEETNYDDLIEKLRNELEENNDKAFNMVVEQKRKLRMQIIKQKKEQIRSIKQSKEEFIPYLDVKSKEIYMGIDGTIIFVSDDNPNITGKYWDVQEYRNRFKKVETKSEMDYEKESIDSLLKFFASEYGRLLLGKIQPEFIIEQLLDAELFLVY